MSKLNLTKRLGSSKIVVVHYDKGLKYLGEFLIKPNKLGKYCIKHKVNMIRRKLNKNTISTYLVNATDDGRQMVLEMNARMLIEVDSYELFFTWTSPANTSRGKLKS